ncbi:MAG: 30S ribosomal protein S13 [Candidatus Kerfeldbacteria bacterium]|nr:30S ribosomal protein S13 [Candidatus Kerfeldbacteria bacterium]
MAIRIAGITLPPTKRIEFALTAIYGIGRAHALRILQEANVAIGRTTESLNEQEVNALRDIIEKRFRVEGELRREVLANIKRLKEIGAYRGVRHTRGLPVRGQRTKTNSRTVRGNVRRTMGSGRRAAAEKT